MNKINTESIKVNSYDNENALDDNYKRKEKKNNLNSLEYIIETFEFNGDMINTLKEICMVLVVNKKDSDTLQI